MVIKYVLKNLLLAIYENVLLIIQNLVYEHESKMPNICKLSRFSLCKLTTFWHADFYSKVTTSKEQKD